MKIAILSDTHNNISGSQFSCKMIAAAGVNTIIHCGDVVDSEILEYFGEYRMFLAYGNGDYPEEIKERIAWFRDDNLSAAFLELNLDGKQIFIIHGHDRRKLDDAIQSGKFDYVFHGHTHRYRDENFGKTRVINPGALGGRKIEARSFVILDLTTDSLERIFLEPG